LCSPTAFCAAALCVSLFLFVDVTFHRMPFSSTNHYSGYTFGLVALLGRLHAMWGLESKSLLELEQPERTNSNAKQTRRKREKKEKQKHARNAKARTQRADTGARISGQRGKENEKKKQRKKKRNGRDRTRMHAGS
jgi:hypothetical protein